MEGDFRRDLGPVLCIIAPLGEEAPARLSSVQDKVTNGAGVFLGSGRADHLADHYCVFTFRVTAVDGDNLVGDIDCNMEGDRFRRGYRCRRIARKHNGSGVKQKIPGFLSHNAVNFKSVLRLKRLDGISGVSLEVSGHRSLVISEIRQPLLKQLDIFSGRTIGQALFISNRFNGIRIVAVNNFTVPFRLRRNDSGAGTGTRIGRIDQSLCIAVCFPGGSQSHFYLECADRLRCCIQINACDFSGVVPKDRQPGLQAGHICTG